jgi:hypothetical protein
VLSITWHLAWRHQNLSPPDSLTTEYQLKERSTFSANAAPPAECLPHSPNPYFCRPSKAIMQYREIVAVTGLGGLYQLLGTKSDGAIVRSLGEQSTRFISSRQHNVTPLESIEIYTTGDNVRLHEIFQKMKDGEQARPEPKATPEQIRSYFREVYPDMDEQRVYVSDMKKMLKWFEILRGADLLDFSSMHPEASSESDTADVPTGEIEESAQVAEHEKAGDLQPEAVVGAANAAPAKKARAKKAAPAEGDGEQPAKKTSRKKAEKTGDDTAGPAAKKTAKAKKTAEE